MAVTVAAEHGYRGYKAGCRCDVCRAANTLSMARYRVRRVRNGGFDHHVIVGGHLTVPIKPVRKQLTELHRRMTWDRMGELCGIKGKSLREIHYRNRTRVAGVTAKKIASLYADVCGPVERDRRRFPAEPLLAEVRAKYGSLKAAGDEVRRNLNRMAETGMSADQYDKWAMALVDKLPCEIWPDFDFAESRETSAAIFPIGRPA